MANYKIVKCVHRKEKAGSGTIKIIMVILAVLFMIMGIMFSRGFMMPCFLMAGLYFFYDAGSVKDYEYILEDRTLQIDVIRGHRYRSKAHELDLEGLVVLAPHDSEEVAQWRKGGSEKIRKFDYTSYEDEVPYYTMIINENNEKIKLLLDLDEEMLDNLKRKYPNKVYR